VAQSGHHQDLNNTTITNDDFPTAGVSWKDLHGDSSPMEAQ
jgi:hypothetical protein